MNFKPLIHLLDRVNNSKNEGDLAYFYELVSLGEFITKNIAIFLVSCINDDNEKTRFRYEGTIVRSNAIGDFARIIDEILTGPAAQYLCDDISDFERKELTKKVANGEWQFEGYSNLINAMKVFQIQGHL